MAPPNPKLGLLPWDRCSADSQWISEKLSCLNYEDRAKICRAYSKAFRDAVDNEPLERKKINQGRFTANTRLRIFIKKRFAIFNKD
jgi:hypothetical protein